MGMFRVYGSPGECPYGHGELEHSPPGDHYVCETCHEIDQDGDGREDPYDLMIDPEVQEEAAAALLVGGEWQDERPVGGYEEMWDDYADDFFQADNWG